MENKTKDIFLLGAGASVEAGLPTASELFDRLSNDVNNSEWKNLLIELKKTSGNKFEDAISALDFVSNQNFSNLELNLLKIITNNQFDITKERLVDIYKLIDYIKRLWINQKFIIKNPENVKYLFPLIEYCNECKSDIFTLNYDNTIEIASKTLDIKYSTGFGNPNELGVEFFSTENFIKKDHQFNLYKMHGSVGWFISKFSPDNLYNNVYKPLKYNENDFEEKISKPAIILGSKNKLTSEGMYLDLLSIFRRELINATNIYIIGYSFTDSHINKYIQEVWSNYPKKNVIIVDPFPPDFNTLPRPSFLGGAYEVKGGFDFRNLFCAVGNPLKNTLYISNKRTSEFCRNLEKHTIDVANLNALFGDT